MKRFRQKIQRWCLAGIISLLLLSGCSSSYMGDREYGFRLAQKSVSSASQPSDLFYTVSLPRVHVMIVGSRRQLDARMQVETVSEPVIWVIGKRVAGKIVVDEAFLGEQIQRLLQQHLAEIAVPDSPGNFQAAQPGLELIHRSFEHLEATPDLNAKVSLSNVRIMIVGSQQQFQASEAAAFHASTLGYATPDNSIWVIGSSTHGHIAVNTAVLGHEFTHLLNFAAPAIAHPDMLDSLFAFSANQ